jgi:hypothetical protein
LYLAVDASGRRYFKYTLNGWYGNLVSDNHVFHIHVEDHATSVLDKSKIADVSFVQAVCNNFNGAGLKIDGVWGPATRDAFRAINNAWSFSANTCDPETSSSAWFEWNNLVMKHGFSDRAAGAYTSIIC